MTRIPKREQLDEGDRIEVFDWHPDVNGDMWQMATVTHIDDYEIEYRLDAYPGAITRMIRGSDYWRLPKHD